MRIKWSFLLKIWSQFNLFQFLIQKNRKCLQNQIVISLLTSNTSSLFSCSFHAQSSSATTISVSFWSKISSVTSFAINFVVMLSFAATFQHFLAVLAIETHFVPTKKNKSWYDLIEMQEIQCFKTGTLWNVKNTKCELLPLPERFFLFGEINLLWTTWTNSWHFDALWSKTLSPNNCLNEV